MSISVALDGMQEAPDSNGEVLPVALDEVWEALILLVKYFLLLHEEFCE